VGRPGLEPGTHGLKVDRCIALSALPAQTLRRERSESTQCTAIPQRSFHDSFHGVDVMHLEVCH